MHFTDTMRLLTKKSEVRMVVPNWRKVWLRTDWFASSWATLCLGSMTTGLCMSSSSVFFDAM